MQVRMLKKIKVLTRRMMVLVALYLGDDWEVMWARGMCWTLCLCLYRMTTMKPLAQSMSMKHTTSGDTINAAYNESEDLS